MAHFKHSSLFKGKQRAARIRVKRDYFLFPYITAGRDFRGERTVAVKPWGQAIHAGLKIGELIARPDDCVIGQKKSDVQTSSQRTYIKFL